MANRAADLAWRLCCADRPRMLNAAEVHTLAAGQDPLPNFAPPPLPEKIKPAPEKIAPRDCPLFAPPCRP